MNLGICKRCCGAVSFSVCSFSEQSRRDRALECSRDVYLYDCIEIFDDKCILICTAIFGPQDSLLGLFDFSGASKHLDEDGFEILCIHVDDIGDSVIDKELYQINWVTGINGGVSVEKCRCPYKMEHDVHDWSNSAV